LASPREKPARRLLAITVIVGVCLLLGYGALSESIAAALAPSRPDIALAWRPGDAGALQAQAETRVGEALTDSEIGAALASGRQALKAAPLTVSSVRTLAEAHQLAGDRARSEALMDLAGRRNLRDSKVQMWLFRRELDAGRYASAFQHADLLMRKHVELAPTLYPSMVATLDKPAAREAFLALMRTDPQWRSDFINAETGDVDGVALWLLSNLATSPHPPTEREVSIVAAALAGQGRWADVRTVWNRFGGGGAGLLFDGDFERANRAPPFGWRFFEQDSATAAVEAVDGGANHALYAQFPVGRSSALAEQLVMLEPGRYRLSGRAKVDTLPSEALFRWTLSCSNQTTPLVGVQQAAAGGWVRFETVFETPATGCDAQWLRLSGTGGVGYAPATAWYDDLRLERVQ
jgi:hypothetical protein